MNSIRMLKVLIILTAHLKESSQMNRHRQQNLRNCSKNSKENTKLNWQNKEVGGGSFNVRRKLMKITFNYQKQLKTFLR